MKRKNSPLISIIISNFNGSKLNTLQECLGSLKKIDYPNYELILVDNASTDNSTKVAEKMMGKVNNFRIIRNKVNMYSQGVNLAFKDARGEYIALFNNDIEFGKDYLEKLLRGFKRYPKLAVAQGKVLWYFDHLIIDSAGESMDVYGNPVTIGYRSRDIGNFDKDEEVLSVTGAACLIKREALEKVGIYEDNFGIGYEDMDHGLRFRQAGYTMMRIGSAVCYHKRGVTDLSSDVRVRVRWHFNKNRLQTMIRNYPFGLLLKTIPVTMLIYIGSMVWEVIAHRNVALAMTRVQSVVWILSNIWGLILQRGRIRKGVSHQTDQKILKLFAPSDILGKIRAVIMDKISLRGLQYNLPWTYPSEIRALMIKGASVLDVGCGDGYLMEWINCRGEYEVVGVDINKQDLTLASTRVCLFKDNQSVYRELVFLDITKDLNFKKKFDVVLCSQVVEHLEKDQALSLISRLEGLAKKRVIVATINGFFQFDHRTAQKHDVHLSGWSPSDFQSLGYKVQGQGLRLVYKPGMLKDRLPFLNPLWFGLSYLLTPLIRNFTPLALLQIAYKDKPARS